MKKTILIFIVAMTLSLAGCNEKKLEKANEYLNQQEYEKAEKIFTQISNGKDKQD